MLRCEYAHHQVTQLSLLRLISNPSVMKDHVVSRSQAGRVIDQLWAGERVLWSEEPDQVEAVFRAISARNDNSHKLWTDDYLAAFAQASGASLARLDAEFKDRYPSVDIDQLT
jgi:uncharacterized protein